MTPPSAKKKLILKLPRFIDLELEFVDPPSNGTDRQPVLTVALPVEVDAAGNAKWNGCGCGGGNCSC